MTKQTNQINLYSISTGAFFTDEERALQLAIYNAEDTGEDKNKLKKELDKLLGNYKGMRVLNSLALTDRKIISQFESSLTRALSVNTNELTKDMMIVQAYQYLISDSLITNGFSFEGEHYIYVFSSAGQIKDKKLVFIKKSKYEDVQGKLFAGITDEIVNAKGGISTNKLIAYKALSASSSVPWTEFDIDKAIVVKDFDHILKNRTVDYIDKNYNIERKQLDLVNPVVDGCGMMLSSISDKNIQFRAPFFKGLLSIFDFKGFIVEHNASPIVTDAWDKEWDVLEDDIQVIFTTSQFKLWKYVDSWDEYKKNFKEYKSEFSIVDIEVDTFENKRMSYQMLQTLYKMPQSDLEKVASYTKDIINNASNDTKSMLEFIGISEGKEYAQPWQQALLLDNSLINDAHFKKMVKDKKSQMIRDGRAGKLIIPNTKRTYIIPDLFAFSQHLFGLEVNGLLRDGEVSCKLYEDNKELDVLRDPHLGLEHCVRLNKVNDDIAKWFTTNGIYTSVNDSISTQLMFDVDGDQALICSDETIVKNAKEHMTDVVPLSFEMGVAEAKDFNSENVVSGLKSAFSKNIGGISNKITKIWNQDVITDTDLNNIKRLVYENNLCIDYSKTLFYPSLPLKLKQELKKFNKVKSPSFFMYAKDKKASEVNDRSNSTVNRLYEILRCDNLRFSGETFNQKMLMSSHKVNTDKKIVDKYVELTSFGYFKMKAQKDAQGDIPAQLYIIKTIREELLKLNDDAFYIADVLVKYLDEDGTEYKKFLWDCFGGELLWTMKKNLGKLNKCSCGTSYEPSSNRQKLCEKCGKEAKKEAARLRKQKQREKKIS